jgi:biotin carboxyl carrier protein
VNEIASRWGAERVSFGLLRGRYVKMMAMSQTEHLNRKMELVQAIESAMEECLDQDTEVLYPAGPQTPVVNRTAEQLSSKHGPATVASLPLRWDGQVRGVLTLERPPDRPWTAEEVGFLRVAADLCTPRLVELSESDRWAGARAAAGLRRGAAKLVGPHYTWAKLLAVALLAGVLALIYVPGTHRVEAPFRFAAVVQRSVPAPFAGYLDEVTVEPDDVVAAGQVLARLDTTELRAERERLLAERVHYQKEAALAGREGEQARRQIAEAQVQMIEAQLGYVGWQIEHAEVRAPLAGTLLEGDLKRRLGAPVEQGEVLFEVAPLNRLRAELMVDDQKIAWVPRPPAARGKLAVASDPQRKLPFTVEKVFPLAEVVDGRNVYTVRARVDEPVPWARPGMEGGAKIDAGQAPIGWVWTRDAVNWVRMKLWL